MPSDPGTAGAPWVKRCQLFGIGLRLVSGDFVNIGILRRFVACCIHPFMHFKQLMSVFHRYYKWQATFEDHSVVRWPVDVRDEIAIASLLLSIAITDLRRQVSPRVYATDATPTSGGSTEVRVSNT